MQDPPKAISLQHKLIKNTVQKFMSHTIFIYASIVLVVLIIFRRRIYDYYYAPFAQYTKTVAKTG